MAPEKKQLRDALHHAVGDALFASVCVRLVPEHKLELWEERLSTAEARVRWCRAAMARKEEGLHQ